MQLVVQLPPFLAQTFSSSGQTTGLRFKHNLFIHSHFVQQRPRNDHAQSVDFNCFTRRPRCLARLLLSVAQLPSYTRCCDRPLRLLALVIANVKLPTASIFQSTRIKCTPNSSCSKHFAFDLLTQLFPLSALSFSISNPILLNQISLMFSVMTPTRHIAPGTPVPVSLAPTPPPPPTQNPTLPPPPQSTAPPLGANDVIFVGNQAFNGRGYEVCGVRNQRGRLCGRIGTCPFHSKSSAAKRPKPSHPAASSQAPHDSPSTQNCVTTPATAAAAVPANAFASRQMPIPPRKARFKRSWTPEEHKSFLKAMQLHGKGKWKEIALEVKTRTANQCQSHAQKYFLRRAKSDAQRKKKSIHDITEDDVTRELKEATARQSVSQAQSLSQGVTFSTSHAEPISVTSLPMSSSPVIASSQLDSTLPLAPRQSAESAASVEMSSSSPNESRLPTPMGPNNNPSMGVHSDSDLFFGLRASLPMNTAAVNSPPISTSAIPSPPTASAPTHPMSVVATSNGMSTVPIVFPMTSLGLQYASMVPSFINPSVGNPGMAAVMAPPPLPKTRVTIHANGRIGGGKALMLPQTMEEFFQLAETKLLTESPLSRVFTRCGAEIAALDEMCQDDMLWLSCGEDFMTPR